MGTILKGILGGFSGLTGTVVGSEWRGIDVIKSRPKKSNKPPTVAQLRTQMIFKMMSDFLQEIKELVDFGYQSNKTGRTPYNAAMAYNIENAVTGTYPLLTIDYSKVQIANGGLKRMYSNSITASTVAEIDLTWAANVQPNHPRYVDKITILAFCPMAYEFVSVEQVVTRGTGHYTLSVPASFSTELVHCWAFYSDVTGKRVSDSKYMGSVTVL